MTIAYIIEKLSGKGGMERILTDKMNYLAEQTAHKVVVMLLWKDEKPLAYPLSEKVQVIRLNVPCTNPLVRFSVVLWRFRTQIRRVNPDITVYTWVAGAFLACYGGWKGKSIYESHDSFHDMKHRNLIMKAAQKVDCLVTLTDGDARNFSSIKQVRVIPNFTVIKPETADYSSKHCLWIGRITEKKDLSRMISIWEQVIKNNPAWVLDIVGEGPEREHITHLVEEKQLQDNVILHPATDNVVEYYSHSSIYLLTSKFEGLPLVLIEAQTCGLPIVAFDCDFGPRQVITDGVNGNLIPYNDDQSFIDKLSALIADKDLRQKMGEESKVASQHFQKDTIMSQWLSLFSSL